MQHISVQKRDAKEIMKMIEKQKANNNLHDSQPQVSYEEACEQYKYYKSRTLKVNVEEADFKQNMAFREFYLGIKKRYDMQQRAHRFRVKQKKEIAKLKMVAQNQDVPKEEEVTTPYLGKRQSPEEAPSVEDKMEEMKRKIQKLEEELQKKDELYKDLQDKSSIAPQEVPQCFSAQQSTSQTIVKPQESKVDNLIDETESENEEFGCDSVRVSSKPSPLHFGENIQMKKQTSLTPVHKADKTFEQNDKKLIIKIEGVSDEQPMSQQDSSSVKDEKPDVQSVMSSSVQASEFVKTPKVQSLIRQIINLKTNQKNRQSKFKFDQPQISEK